MSRFVRCAVLVTSALACTLPVQAAGVLSPLSTSAASSGTGLRGNWFKIDDTAHISNVEATDANGVTMAIKEFGWGDGIWSVQDLTAATNPANHWIQATATTTSAVSFANHTYNGEVFGPNYGNWAQDMLRPLVPASMSETNFVGLFSGYLYVEQGGSFDFGVFGDDGFILTLTGFGNSSTTPLVKQGVLNSPGRELLTMDDLSLDAGFYGISLDFFNRLEAGVIDLVWRPVGGQWQTIDSRNLYAGLPTNGVPEPGSLMLVGLALASLVVIRRRAVTH